MLFLFKLFELTILVLRMQVPLLTLYSILVNINKCYDKYYTINFNKMILLHSTEIENTRASIHINDRDDCQSSEKMLSDNDKHSNA